MARNRLAGEASPYLQQHAENPVDWYPWGEGAFEEAERRDVPVLLSVGYSTCHWCHVMARESFEDDDTAALINENFVPVKVDREERPDVDAVYMEAVQAMTGRGGWPMTVFLTPAGEPFFAGTYFPPESRGGLPGFRDVLRSVADAWEEGREEILSDAERVSEALRREVEAVGEVSLDTLRTGLDGVRELYDPVNGGFGSAPKFPQPVLLDLLLRVGVTRSWEGCLAMLNRTLKRMARGGIYDQIGGGFHRYSVDADWYVPHFEKMLYDNGALLSVYSNTYLLTGDAVYRSVAEETAEYLLREMRSPGGGFFAAQDADSEGVEGLFYTWTPDEMEEVLGPGEAEVVERYFGVSEDGDLEGRSVLRVAESIDGVAESMDMSVREVEAVLERGREVLFRSRERRVRPGRDEKVIAGWNGLAIGGLADAYLALRDEELLEAAEGAASFVLDELRDGDRLRRYWGDGEARGEGVLEDYALVGLGLMRLYQASLDPDWFVAARELGDAALERFFDPDRGVFYDAVEAERLVKRPRSTVDSALPSGGSAATQLLLELWAFTGEERYVEAAGSALRSVEELARKFPSSHAAWLASMDQFLEPPLEVAVAGEAGEPGTEALLDVLNETYRPGARWGLSPPDGDAGEKVPLLRDRVPIAGEATAYVCEGSMCLRPVTEAEGLREMLP